MDNEQQARARQQFRFIEQLSPPGRWWKASQQEGLEVALRRAVAHSVTVGLNPAATTELRHETTGSVLLPVTALGAVATTSDVRLLPGTYSLARAGDGTAGQTIVLGAGDLLQLGMTPSGNGTSYRKLGFAETAYPWRPHVTGSLWRTSVLSHRLAEQNRVEALISIEMATCSEAQEAPAIIDRVNPVDLWFEYAFPRHDSQPAVTWHKAYGYPATCWKLIVVPSTDEHRLHPQTPSLRAWWTTARDKSATRTLRKGQDYAELAELVGKTWDVHGIDVEVLRISTEVQSLPGPNGSDRPQTCLTVDLRVPNEQLVKVRPIGWTGVSQRHQHFAQVNRYIAQFWPVSSEQIDDVVTGVDFVAIDQLKANAEMQGNFAELKELGPPMQTDRMPVPQVDLFSEQ